MGAMDLLTNAVESIQAGVADYQKGTRPRLLSAVRNIHAGILLLYKEALVRRSPPSSDEALVKAKLRPVPRSYGRVEFVGVGKRTVDVRMIRERFESLGIATDWTRFRKISDIRNDVEHYYPQVSQESLREVVSSAFWIVRSFITGELTGEPVDLLGRETWQVMLEVADVFEAERQSCDEALEEIDWGSATLGEGIRRIRCTACSSTLLRPQAMTGNLDDVVLACGVCGAEKDADVFVAEAVAGALEWEMYLAFADGADEPYGECPECLQETYVVAEAGCARCGAEFDGKCARCGNGIPPSELVFSPLCAYCDHVMSKDD